MLAEANGQGLDGLFIECQYIKTTSWASEREWRIVSFAGMGDPGLYSDMGFSPLELHALYLGAHCPASEQATIRALLTADFGHVQLHQAKSGGSDNVFTFERLQ